MPRLRTRPRTEAEVIGFLAFMSIMLAFAIDVSLPAFDEIRTAFDLPADSNRVSLIVTLYFVGLAGGQVVYGPLADHFGRAPALRVGVLIYAVGAAGSMLAQSMTMLLASRVVWGLGAAGPGVLRTAIARDLYKGNEMARVMSIMMAFFLIGPIFAPLIGEGILQVGSWRWVFAAGLILAAVMMLWSLRFGETLDPANRQPLELHSTVAAFRRVLRTRTTMAYLLAMMFGFGAFFVYLGSSQPIFDEIYGREDQFALLFGASGILMAVAYFVVNRFIVRFGAHQVAVFAALVFVALGAIHLAVVLATGGRPNFWVWLGFVAVSNAFVTLLTPTCFSLGLEPMGDLAGTASGVMGLIGTAGASLLAGAVDARISTTVTPMAAAYVLYGSVAVAALLWAGRSRRRRGTIPFRIMGTFRQMERPARWNVEVEGLDGSCRWNTEGWTSRAPSGRGAAE